MKNDSKLIVAVIAVLIGIVIGLFAIAICSCSASQPVSESSAKNDTLSIILKPKF